MKRAPWALGLIASLALMSLPAAAQVPCKAGPGQVARAVAGKISAGKSFHARVGRGWTFQLAADPFGWNVRLLDKKGLDLTQLTPPYRGAPNPRDILGWHFRNAGNTGPNEGSVNAPQALRQFYISPSLTGTGGFRPSAATVEDPAAFEGQGRGSLRILDYRLADLEPGKQARMIYLKFEACLTWPSGG